MPPHRSIDGFKIFVRIRKRGGAGSFARTDELNTN